MSNKAADPNHAQESQDARAARLREQIELIKEGKYPRPTAPSLKEQVDELIDHEAQLEKAASDKPKKP